MPMAYSFLYSLSSILQADLEPIAIHSHALPARWMGFLYGEYSFAYSERDCVDISTQGSLSRNRSHPCSHAIPFQLLIHGKSPIKNSTSQPHGVQSMRGLKPCLTPEGEVCMLRLDPILYIPQFKIWAGACESGAMPKEAI